MWKIVLRGFGLGWFGGRGWMGGKGEQDKKGTRRSWGWDGMPLIIEQRRRGAGKRTRGRRHTSINVGRSNQPCLHVGKGTPPLVRLPSHQMVTGVPGPSSIRLPSQTGLQALVAPYAWIQPTLPAYEVRTGAVGGGVEAGGSATPGGGLVAILAARSRLAASGARWRAVTAGNG